MKGTVYAMNRLRGIVAVQTEYADFSIFQILDEDRVDLGDHVYWKDDTGVGNTVIKNITQDFEFEVIFQNHWVPKHKLKEQLMMSEY